MILVFVVFPTCDTQDNEIIDFNLCHTMLVTCRKSGKLAYSRPDNRGTILVVIFGRLFLYLL